jgi:hypothetical protein
MGSGGSTAGNYVQKRSVHLKEGDKVPLVKFKARVKEIGNGKPADSYVWRDISTEDLFKGKRVVLFGVPGGNVFSLLFFDFNDIFFFLQPSHLFVHVTIYQDMNADMVILTHKISNILVFIYLFFQMI